MNIKSLQDIFKKLVGNAHTGPHHCDFQMCRVTAVGQSGLILVQILWNLIGVWHAASGLQRALAPMYLVFCALTLSNGFICLILILSRTFAHTIASSEHHLIFLVPHKSGGADLFPLYPPALFPTNPS